ncbi:phosphorylated adapter RNA export protein-like [Hydra vulgaris]|uniref:phosphorylated adapter RNA export protein-like n=1 Tax=Hydra vulgaris TaxID=6087 RepID=UPI001F5E3C0E|nr:phosphorylated adapter RNA export protein isoform X2 [Hydra vulgaris]
MEKEFELELFDNDIEMEEDELQQELKLLEMESKRDLNKNKKCDNLDIVKKKDELIEKNLNEENLTKNLSSASIVRSSSKQNQTINQKVNFKKLFKPLQLDKSSLYSIAGRELAYRLEENKAGLLGHVFRVLGLTLTMEIFEETKKIMKNGGLKTDSGDRRRSPGGTFLYLMKSRGYATKSQLKEIFKEEEALKKKLLKQKYKQASIVRKNKEKMNENVI